MALKLFADWLTAHPVVIAVCGQVRGEGREWEATGRNGAQRERRRRDMRLERMLTYVLNTLDECMELAECHFYQQPSLLLMPLPITH